MRIKLFFTGLVFLAATTMLSAQGNEVKQNQQTPTVTGIAFVDANNNGVCDNFENRAANESAVRQNYCRFNDQGQPGPGQGQRLRLRNGMGQGQRMENGTVQGRGRNVNFVDADKNGVCDYFEASSKK